MERENEREREGLPPVTPHPRTSGAVTTARERRNAGLPGALHFLSLHMHCIQNLVQDLSIVLEIAATTANCESPGTDRKKAKVLPRKH